MATDLVRSFSIADAQIWQGGSLLLTGTSASAFPSGANPSIEQVIDLNTYAPTTGWSILGPTTEDGVTVAREWDEDAGIATDQRDTPFRGGLPTNVRMSLTCTLLYSDAATLQYAWQLGNIATISAGAGNAAQSSMGLGDNGLRGYKKVAVLQQTDAPTGNFSRVRMFVFRQGLLNPPNTMQWHSRDIARLQIGIRFIADNSQVDGSEYGLVFESTAAPVA